MEWHSLGDVNYRRWRLHKMTWQIELSDILVARGGPAGGPLALVRRTKIGGIKVLIFSSAGEPLAAIPDQRNELLCVGWTEQELLLLVFEGGRALVHDVLGNLVQTFFLLAPTANPERDIVQVCSFGSSVVALTSSMDLYVCDNVDVVCPVVYTLRTGLSVTVPATSLVLLRSCLTASGLVEVLIGTADNSILVVDANGPDDQRLQGCIQAPIISMALAPNGRFLACFTALGTLSVVSTSFTTKVLDFDTSNVFKPLEMEWCGEDSVLLYWASFLLMVGPYGHWLKFVYTTPIFLIPEIDCCRIVTSSTCELLQRVPASIEIIHRIGSTHPSALLYDSIEYENRDVREAESIFCADLSELLSAIETNVSAAVAEIIPFQQKMYLCAAAHGNGLVHRPSLHASSFVMAARRLRVLNQVRRHTPALCLTSSQYDQMSLEVLLDRLLARNHHFLALSISLYLGSDNERVIIHWACVRLRSSQARAALDKELGCILKSRLEILGHCIPDVTIAATADIVGRRKVATALLNSKFSTIEQVKLLLTMREYELALSQALNSRAVDIVHLVLITIDRTHPRMMVSNDDVQTLLPILNTIKEQGEATNLLRVYYQFHALTKSSGKLHNLFVHDPKQAQFHQAGNLALRLSYLEASRTGRFNKLREVISLYAQARDLQFQCKATEDQIELLELQSNLETKYGIACFFDMSINETLHNLIVLGATHQNHVASLFSDANKLQRRFRVPERRFAHTKVKALATSGQWAALKIFSTEKKSPIGYAPYVRVCAEHNRSMSDIESYMGHLNPDERWSLCAELNLWKPVVDAAIQSKDDRRLVEIHGRCADTAVQASIDEYLSR